jgi:hypothetical protein
MLFHSAVMCTDSFIVPFLRASKLKSPAYRAVVCGGNFRDFDSGGSKLKFVCDTSYSEILMVLLSPSGAGIARSVYRLRCGLEDSSPDSNKTFLLSSECSDICGTPILLSNRYPGSFLRVKPSKREVSHSSPSTAEFKNECRYTSTPTHAFMA